MKRNKLLYFIGLLLASGCGDVLDVPNPSAVSPEIWDNEATATLYLNERYEASMERPGQKRWGAYSGRTDESFSTDDFVYGRLTSSSAGDFSLPYYQRIRYLNIAIEEASAGDMPDDAKGRIIGQALWLRAMEYWELVRQYGGVPLVLDVQNPYREDVNVPRSSARACIEQIVEDLDGAIEGLPASWPDNEYGRVTRGAAAGLKGRVLLYWASPQFNPNNEQDRWEAAYQANVEAKQMLDEDGHGLYPDFDRIFLDENNEEFIYGQLFNPDANKQHGWEDQARPRAVGFRGGNFANPSWEMVQAFPMANGKAIDDPTSGYDPDHYWVNRDPRFYATIAYNGMEWVFEGFESGRKQWHYYIGGTSIEPTAPTTTGFYCRKAIDTSIPQDRVWFSGVDWIEMRYGEVLLNLAETAAETGNDQVAYDQLIALRERAGIAPGTNGLYGLASGLSGDDLVDAVMHERQVEMAFEGKRYWDLRRRNLYAEELNGTRRHGVRTILRPEIDPGEFKEIRDEIDLDTEFENYFTYELWLKDEEMAINHPQPRYNFFAIPPNILDRSPAVEQTIGWENGTFDPLAD